MQISKKTYGNLSIIDKIDWHKLKYLPIASVSCTGNYNLVTYWENEKVQLHSLKIDKSKVNIDDGETFYFKLTETLEFIKTYDAKFVFILDFGTANNLVKTMTLDLDEG